MVSDIFMKTGFRTLWLLACISTAQAQEASEAPALPAASPMQQSVATQPAQTDAAPDTGTNADMQSAPLPPSDDTTFERSTTPTTDGSRADDADSITDLATDTDAQASMEAPGADKASLLDAQRWVNATFNWLESGRDRVSSRVNRSATALDAYLARDVFDTSETNESYLLMNLDASASSGYEEEAGASFRGKLDIPNSRHRLNLFVDSRLEDFDGISERRRDVPQELNEDSTDDAVIGLSLLTRELRHWETQFSVGARFTFPMDPYARISTKRYFDLIGAWQSRLLLSGSHFDSRGARGGIEYDVYRRVREKDVFRISNEAQFLDQTNVWEFFHGYSYYQRLQHSSLEYSLSASGLSQPEPQVSAYWVRVQWRKRLYKQWLFGKLAPEVSFPRDRDFDATYALFLGLEVYFSEQPVAQQAIQATAP